MCSLYLKWQRCLYDLYPILCGRLWWNIAEANGWQAFCLCSCKLYSLVPGCRPPEVTHKYALCKYVTGFSPYWSSRVETGSSVTLWQSLEPYVALTPVVNMLPWKIPSALLCSAKMWSWVRFSLINWPFLLTRNLCSNNLLGIDAERRKWDIHQRACALPAAPQLIWKYFRLHRPCCLCSQDYIYPRSIACLTGAHGGLW